MDSEADKLVVVQSDADWLAEVNRWRTEAGAQAIGENVGLSLGATEHARYLVENGPKDARSFISYTQTIDGAAHTENPDNPYYTKDGYQAATKGDVGFECNPVRVVDDLVEVPFHRLSILAPWMRAAGYGDFGHCPMHAATLVMRGSTPVGLSKVVMFPPDRATVEGAMSHGEWPSPLAACPGYVFPVGTAITMQMGAFVKVQLESYAIDDDTDGRQVEACGFDANTYPDEWGQRVLRNYGAVVVIPRNPLIPNHSYRVSIRTHRHSQTWSFHVSSETPSARSAESP